MMEKIERLTEWAIANGATLNKSVEIYDDEQYGICLRSKAEIQSKEQIVSCPFTLSLSYLNALEVFPSLPAHPNFSPLGAAGFPAALLEAVDTHVIGRLFLVLQYLLAEVSFWRPYVASLPQPDEHEKLATPVYYSEEERKYLEDTQVGAALLTKEKQWQEEWRTSQAILDSAEGWEALYGKWTWELYRWAATIFSSRSFISSLMPDNLFQEPTDLRAEALFNTITPSQRSAKTLVAGVIPVLFPLVDLANHSPQAQVTWFTDVMKEPMDLGLVSEVDLPAHEQIFNNYAPKGNSQLLLGYGFVLPENDDVVLAPRALSGSSLKMKTAWSDLMDESDGKSASTYTLRTKPFPYEEAGRHPAFARLENGCVDHLSLLLVNEREMGYLKPYADQRLEINSLPLLDSSLGRAVLAVASTLQDMLVMMLHRILESSKLLSEPTTTTTKVASQYRQGQIQLLNTAIAPLTTLLHDRLAYEPTPDRTTLLSLSTAFLEPLFLSGRRNQRLQNAMLLSMRKNLELEAGEELKWDELEEDWGFTLWCFWTFGQLLDVWRREPDPAANAISSIHASGVYNRPDMIEAGFCGEESEWEVYQAMVLDSDAGRFGWDMLSEGEAVGLMLEAAQIVKNETILVQGKTDDGGAIQRRLMCLHRTTA